MLGLDLFFFSSRRRHTRFDCDWSSDVCSSDLRRCTWAAKSGSASSPCVGACRATSASGSSSDGAAACGSARSEERRVGEEGRSRWAPYHLKKKRGKRRFGTTKSEEARGAVSKW